MDGLSVINVEKLGEMVESRETDPARYGAKLLILTMGSPSTLYALPSTAQATTCANYTPDSVPMPRRYYFLSH